MKLSITPSPFVNAVLTFTFLIMSQSVFSQQEIDSTDFYRKILLNPSHDSNIEAAFAFYEKGYLRDLSLHDTLSAVSKLRTMGIGQSQMGAIYESEASVIKAMGLLENLPNKSTIYHKKGIYGDLGTIYRRLESHDNALSYYDKGLEISESVMDSLTFINNKGNVFVDMGNYDLALKEFEIALKMIPRVTDSLIQATILDNLGFTQSKMNNPESLENMHKALEIRKKSQNLSGLYSSHRHLALHFYDRNLDVEALEYAEEAYRIAKLIDSPSYIENSLRNLLKIKDYAIGKEYIALNDSLNRAKQQRENKYSAMQYNIGKEKEKTEANRLLQEQEKRKKQTFQILGVFLLIALTAYYFIQKSLNKRKILHQIYHTETRISKKVHDEVANDVYHLMNKIQLKIIENDGLLDDLEKIYKKTRDISRQNSEMVIEKDFTEQLSGFLKSYQNEETRINILNISKINWQAVSDHKKTALYRVLQELMINMKKHSKSTQVLLSFEQNKNRIQIKYRDNGVGSSLENKNGLLNAENRIKAIDGSITFENDPQKKGFKATIII